MKKDKRIRRSKSERESVIEVSDIEFQMLVAYANIISENLADFMKKELKYNITILACPTINKQKLESDILNGERKISNTLVFVMTLDDNENSWQDSFIKFAKENRYLNIGTSTDCGLTTIKVENSDKYQYFNITASTKKNAKAIYFNIDCRRLYKISNNNSIKKFKRIIRLLKK